MIGPQVEHTQGERAMKGELERRQRRNWRIGTLAVLLPLALGTTAQTAPAERPAVVAQAPAAGAAAAASVTVPAPVIRPLPALPADFDTTEFEAIAQSLVADQRVPGLAMAIVRGGQVLSARGYGVTDADGGEPIDAHTVFRLASLSKAFAGTVTGLLVNQGALRWDSRVTDYMPALQLSEPGAAQELTVAEVLSHRVGLTRNAYDRDIEANVDYASLVQKLAYAPMTCRPGECYAYQNVAFSLIGDVVAQASGRSYAEEVSRLIFKPLGMRDASVGLEGIEASTRWARPHVRGRGGWVALTPKPTYYRVAPAAGVNASIADMAQWLIAQSGHRPDVLPASLLETLHAPLIETPSEMHGSAWRRERLFDAGYAIGWRVYDYAGHRMVFHGGAVQGYRAAIALLPETDLGVVLLWNSESALPSALMPTILDRALGLPPHWLDDRTLDDTLYARNNPRPVPDDEAGEGVITAGGSESTTARARPQ